MGGFDRLQPGRKVVDEIIASGVAQPTGTTGWTAKFASARYNSWATPLPPSSSARVVAAQAATSSASTSLTILAQPDYPRAVRIVPSSSTLISVAVVVTGLDQFGASATDTINTAATGAAVDGVVTFKTISSIVVPAASSGGTSVTVGLSNIFGLDRQPASVSACIRGSVNGTAETTAPIIGAPSTSGGLGSPTRASAKFSTAATSSAGALLDIYYLAQDMTHA